MVSDILMTGKENAISGTEICKVLHMNARELTQAIEKERRDGLPICASCDSKRPGYYLAANKSEMAEYCQRLRHRVAEICKTRAACMAAMANLPESEA